MKACTDNGWELNAHGYDQVPMHKLDDQRAVIMKIDGHDREILPASGRAAGSVQG